MSTPVRRAAALTALIPVLALSAAVAAYLGWTHIRLTHGAEAFESLCNMGGSLNCDIVNTSSWSELLGVPISAWAVPLYLAMVWLAWVGRRGDLRGARARGALVIVGGWNVVFSLFLAFISFFVIHYICLFCCTLYALHALALLLILLPPGGRKPALPMLIDIVRAGSVALVSTLMLFPVSSFLAHHLDQRVVDQIEAQAAGGARGGEDGDAEGGDDAHYVELPDTIRDVPIRPHDAAQGPADAPVTVVEFADYQCGYCRRTHAHLRSLKARWGDQLRVVFKHYPLDKACNPAVHGTMHPRSCQTATAAQCALRQGHFWEYHDLLYRNQRHLDDADLRHYAETLGLDLPSFERCLADPSILEEIREDALDAHALDVTGTPRSYINGREFRGAVPEVVLEAGVRLALGQAETDAQGRVKATETRVEVEPLPRGQRDMVRLEGPAGAFWIDAVEASIDAQGRAVPVAGVLPANASWDQAQAACAAADKRLCRTVEWVQACQGAAPVDDDADGDPLNDYQEGHAWPYGDVHENGVCHDDREAEGPVATGARSACRSEQGVYDLVGNLQEWIGPAEDERGLAGGAWHTGDGASCATRFQAPGPGLMNSSIGFRCCADEAPTPLEEPDLVDHRAPPLEVGDLLPPLAGDTLEGEPVSPSLLEGKVGVVALWAATCRSCQAEPAFLKRLQQEHGAQGLVVVLVASEANQRLVKARLHRLKADVPVVLDPRSDWMGAVHARTLPTTLVVDTEGRVALVLEGFGDAQQAEIKAMLPELLGAGE